MTLFQIEICVESLAGAFAAWRSGATRIELSELLTLGGVTPRWELIRTVCKEIPLPVIALIRCRPGDFVYSDTELNQMLDDCHRAIDCGAAGVAIGALQEVSQTSFALNWNFLERIALKCSNNELVVHRAFDRISEQVPALERLKLLGFHRVLTSGGSATAIEGKDILKKLVESDTIEILPAGGIRLANAMELIAATGCNQLHGSFQRRDLEPKHGTDSIRMPDEAEITSLVAMLNG